MFKRRAHARTINLVSFEELSKFSRVASVLEDGTRALDIAGSLQKVSKKFAISADPNDYLYEIVRANTTAVPNDNEDAFPRQELLRFSARHACPVFATYRLKPHFIDHKADDPLRSRGVILDAHYNADAAPLPQCPCCMAKTADRANRDESGLLCAKCGEVVKDEYVEALLAVDRSKDPDLVKGIEAGILNSTSMGVGCDEIVCNVCGKVAVTEDELCEHATGGNNKGSLWHVSADGRITQVTHDHGRMLKRQAGYTDGPVTLNCKLPDGSMLRRGSEFCQQAEFEEISRVHRPADKKALTIHILASIADETEELMKRTAAVEMKVPDGAVVEVRDADGKIVAPDAPEAPVSLDEQNEEASEPMDKDQTPEEFGILPPKAAGEIVGPDDKELGDMYDDFKVKANARGVTIWAPNCPVLTCKFPREADQKQFAADILHSVKTVGLVRTAKEHKGHFSFAVTSSLDEQIKNIEGDLGSDEQAANPPMGNVALAKEDVSKPQGTPEAMIDVPKDDAKTSIADPITDSRQFQEQDVSVGKPANDNIKVEAAKLERRLAAIYDRKLAKAVDEMQSKVVRALRIAARRAALNLEESPLKATMFDALTVERSIGRVASTGEEIMFGGLDEDVALNVLESAWSKAAAEEIETLLTRTAEILTYSGEYLDSAERDLQKQSPIVPQISREASDEDSLDRAADAVRRAASYER